MLGPGGHEGLETDLADTAATLRGFKNFGRGIVEHKPGRKLFAERKLTEDGEYMEAIADCEPHAFVTIHAFPRVLRGIPDSPQCGRGAGITFRTTLGAIEPAAMRAAMLAGHAGSSGSSA